MPGRRHRSRRSARRLPPGDPGRGARGGHRHGPPAFHARRQPVGAGQRDARHGTAVAACVAAGARRAASLVATAERFGLRVNPEARVGTPFRRRAAARGDPEGADARRARADPRRAHRGADAAGIGVALRDAVRAGRRRAVDHLHQPQAARGAARVDRIAVLRNGKLVATVPAAQADRASLAHLMVGRDVPAPVARPHDAGRRRVRAARRPRRRRARRRDARACARARSPRSPACRATASRRWPTCCSACARRIPAACASPAARSPARPARLGRRRRRAHSRGSARRSASSAPLPLWENAIAERYRTRFAQRAVGPQARGAALCARHRVALRRARGAAASTRRRDRCPAATCRS